MLRVGYLKLSPAQLSAGLAEPHNELIANGVHRLYIDVDMGQGQWPQLDCAIADLVAGDMLVSPSLATLTRSVAGLMDIHHRLDGKGAALLVLQLSPGLKLDTSTLEGRAVLGAVAVMNVLPAPISAPSLLTSFDGPDKGAAQHERAAALRPRGRPPTAVIQAQEVNRLRSEGLRATDIASCLGIGRASVYRILSQGVVAPETIDPEACPVPEKGLS